MTLRPGYGLRLESARQLLAAHTPTATVDADWPAGRVRLSAYLGAADLPTEIPTRVRCLVTAGNEVLVTWDSSGVADCFPGGGADPGETVLDTAQREVWEETGWHIDTATVRVLGWVHVLSFCEPNPELPFPHPDSFSVVAGVSATHCDASEEPWRDTDGYIARSEFVPLAELPRNIQEDPIASLFLRVAFGDR